jgi:hypothetical protein
MSADSDLSGLQADCDVDMNDIMSVLDQMMDKGTYFITHSPEDCPSDSVAYRPRRPQFDSTAVKRKDIQVDHSHWQSGYVES